MEAIINSSKIKEFTFINELYEGQILSSVKCDGCDHISEKIDNFQDISLPVKRTEKVENGQNGDKFERSNGKNEIKVNCLENAISDFLMPEKLAHDNMYFCNKCDRKVNNEFNKLNKIGGGFKIYKIYKIAKNINISFKSF